MNGAFIRFCSGDVSRAAPVLSKISVPAAALSGQGFGAEISASYGFESVLGFLLVSAVSVLILKSFGFRGAPLVAVVALLAAISYYESAVSEIFGLFSYLSESSDAVKYIGAALKVVGISYLSGISIDICREIGEGGIAKGISLVTKLELTAVAIPFIKEILAAVTTLASA